MLNMLSACDMAHVYFVCAFTCPLLLWPEGVVACWVSLSSVSSGCAKLLLVESGFSDLFFVTISLGFARFFYKHAQPSLLLFVVVLILSFCTNNLPF